MGVNGLWVHDGSTGAMHEGCRRLGAVGARGLAEVGMHRDVQAAGSTWAYGVQFLHMGLTRAQLTAHRNSVRSKAGQVMSTCRFWAGNLLGTKCLEQFQPSPRSVLNLGMLGATLL